MNLSEKFHSFKSWLKLNRNLINFLSISAILYIIQLLFLRIFGPLVLLNENQVLYYFSTAAQSIAGLLGLTLTGYIFLRNELDRQAEEDETLQDSVLALKKRYFLWIILLCVLGATSILMSLVNFAIEDSGTSPGLMRAMFSTTGYLVFMAVIAIIVFAIDILNPNKIENISNLLKANLTSDKDEEVGDVAAFLRSYNQIEQLLQSAVERFDLPSPGPRRRQSNRSIANLLFQRGIIPKDFLFQLEQLIQYRNLTVHGSEIFVDKRMQEDCERIRRLLAEALAR